jgi:hypothetical protein
METAMLTGTYEQKKISKGHACPNCGETFTPAMIADWPAQWQEELHQQEDGVFGPYTCPACDEGNYR